MAATGILHELKSLTTEQRSAVIAAFLGWTLDAFDFFIVVFVLSRPPWLGGSKITQGGAAV